MAAKTSIKHPYAAIEHRVIDSPAYADLSFSSQVLLLLFARQLTKDNNGHLQATFNYMRRFGFASEHTLSRAIKELIAHGFICRTRSGGYQQGAAQYAVTWLSITNRQGLFLDGFKACAWREWQPEPMDANGTFMKKTPPSKMQSPSCKNGMWTTPPDAENAASRPPKSADIELMPCREVFSLPADGVLGVLAKPTAKAGIDELEATPKSTPEPIPDADLGEGVGGSRKTPPRGRSAAGLLIPRASKRP